MNKSETITLECPACKRSVETPRQPEDPLLAVKMTNYCECTQGFDDVHYFDKNGAELAEVNERGTAMCADPECLTCQQVRTESRKVPEWKPLKQPDTPARKAARLNAKLLRSRIGGKAPLQKMNKSDKGAHPCAVCGDTWKAPDGMCYSCWEEKSYKADCDHFNTYGWSPTHGGR